jgi:hypothetical protein
MDKCILWRAVFKYSPIFQKYIQAVEKQKAFRLNWQPGILKGNNNTGLGTGKLTMKEQKRVIQLQQKQQKQHMHTCD